ncbi:MAG: transporter associated domain-containing protein [Tissierellia bacterium]|nr:transporter associated domain-containing protein [Tissierellia bacterium]
MVFTSRKKHSRWINKIIYVLEIILSLLIIAGVLVSIPDILKYYMSILESSKGESYILLREFLSHVLLLVIGLELVMMMIAHSDTSVVYLMVMVIARKMLLMGNTSLDLLIGTVAILCLFVVKKFLIPKKSTDIDPSIGIFSAATSVKDINRRLNYDIDDCGFQTIGGLVYYLTNEQGERLEEGTSVVLKNYIFEIEEMNEGIINSVYIEKIE